MHKIWPWKFVSSMIKPGEKSEKFGLIGTITNDVITCATGRVFRGLGGILYQAAALCGLGRDVFLYTCLGKELCPEVNEIIAQWPTCRTHGIRVVASPGNSVFLHYPEKGERIEVLESHVPPLKPQRIIEELPQLSMLILAINSGFDIALADWRKIVRRAQCPIWFDVHSLALSLNLHTPRSYRPLPEWKDWAEGVTYLQANLKEVASMLGNPAKRPSWDGLHRFGRSAFNMGTEAVFITLGKEGILALTPERSEKIGAPSVRPVVDTTGCGDVFCAAAAAKLADGEDPMAAATFGLKLASEAARVSGIEETYTLVRSR